MDRIQHVAARTEALEDRLASVPRVALYELENLLHRLAALDSRLDLAPRKRLRPGPERPADSQAGA